MVRRGYNSELSVKKKLVKEFGMDNVIKVAIGSFGSDFFIVSKGRLMKCVEVKETHAQKYYPLSGEKEQFKRIAEFCNEHGIKCELHIHYPNIRKWEVFDDIANYAK